MKKLALALLLASTPLWASNAPFTPEQEARIKELVRETLISQPEILAQAADAYDKQAQKQQSDVIKQVVEKNKQALFNDSGSPRLGAANAKLVMVSFTDYNCTFCKQFDPLMEKIVKTYPDVALVIKPLPFRAESSLTSARDALTVWKQDPKKFWDLHHRLMAKKGYHDDASIKAAEKKVGVNLSEPDKQSLDTINKNLALSQHLGIQGTPATLIGDQLLPGAVSYEQLEAVVKSELAKRHDQ